MNTGKLKNSYQPIAVNRMIFFRFIFLIILLITIVPEYTIAGRPADLILKNGFIWTADTLRPQAEAVAIRGDRILAVGSTADIELYATVHTQIIDLEGRFVTPGFIDNHTHFNQAGALLLGINLLDVADAQKLIERVQRAKERLPDGSWILGGDWGAYEDWEPGSPGEIVLDADRERFIPHRNMIDSVTTETPVLLSRWDRSQHLANGKALELADLSCERPVQGLECVDGQATGIVAGSALDQIRRIIPPKSFEQRLIEARIALDSLRTFGVTSIHDITPPDQFPVYEYLRNNNELTTRIYARPTLDKWHALAEIGITHGFGDEYLKIGGLKGFVDGIMGNSTAQFYEPFEHTGGFGLWREMMNPPGTMQQLIIDADAAGHWPQIHAIGDRAIDTLLTIFEQVIEINGDRERRFRIIHSQHLRDADVAHRYSRNKIIAEVQPYHAIDDMRWMEERIGARARWAYAFRTLHDAGVLLSFGSDWPGTNASWYSVNPLLGIYAAVVRKTVDGQPEGGWFPEEKLDVESALRAYTINNAYAAGEENLKGSISPGKLADFAVLGQNLFEIDPHHIKDVKVEMTIVGGKVLFDGRNDRQL
jgi:predicted amidohydrolase YtcJ